MSEKRQNRIIDRFLVGPPDLEGGVDLEVVPLEGQRALVQLRHGGHHFSGRAAALDLPYPSTLSRMMSANPDIEIALVERASQSLVRVAEELGVSCLDLRGMGRVVGPGFVYFASDPGQTARPAVGEITGAESESRRDRPRVSPFAPKASRVVRAVLDRPRERWRVSAVADRASPNPVTVHRILGALVELGFMERDADRYVVIEPGSLLEAWCEQARLSRGDLWLPVLGPVIRDVDRLVSDVEVGVHRGLRVDGVLDTADFGLSAKNPPNTATAVESSSRGRSAAGCSRLLSARRSNAEHSRWA